MASLTRLEAKKRLEQFGPNFIFKPTKISFWGIARHEVTEPMILLLLFVGLVYSLWGKLDDAITIFIIIFLLVMAEVYNEFRAKKAIASLEKIAAPKTKVIRDNVTVEVNTEEVVPGDILVLGSGTKIAADAKLIKSLDITVDESSLTGESFPKEIKEGDPIYAGTIIATGEGLAEVVVTGKDTRLGAIAQTAKSVRPPKTALQLAMKRLAGQLVYVAVFFSILIPLIGILRGQDLKTMVLTGLSLSFATIPEELPIVITMVLGLGAYTLSKKNFLVKKIKAAETLGNATVIVTDKTGTITESKLRISTIYPDKKDEILNVALNSLSQFSASPIDTEIREKAISQAVGEIIRQRNLGDGKKTKSVIRKNSEGLTLYMSGAPEEVFAVCSGITQEIKSALEGETKKGMRVIAFAQKKLGEGEENHDFSSLEKEMAFVGLISFEDPPRKEVKETIAKAAKAGVRTIMITGDHPLTASYIAEKVGIANSKVLTGEDLNRISDEELKKVVAEVSVYARTTPEHKYRIVKALQSSGEVVAVTGDGINDVLALKGADIGIAMGIKGTDVAKEAAEVVLADDNYVTITNGIFEGRKFFDNLQKGIKYYLSVKIALIMIFLLPVLIGIPMPFAPIQIILLELFMDLAASAGYVAEPAENNIYVRPPRDPKQNIINKLFISDIFIKGFILFIAVTSVYFYTHSQTYAFSAWIFAHIILAFIARSEKESIFSIGIFSNRIINLWAVSAVAFLCAGIYIPFLSHNLNLSAINFMHIIYIALTVTLIIGLLEIRKKWYYIQTLRP